MLCIDNLFSFFINYGTTINWNANPTWEHMGASNDVTRQMNGRYWNVSNYVVKVEAQFSRANITRGPLVLCSIRFTTNLGIALPWVGPNPCPFADTQLFSVIFPNGLAYFAGFNSDYGIHQLNLWQKCVSAGKRNQIHKHEFINKLKTTYK